MEPFENKKLIGLRLNNVPKASIMYDMREYEPKTSVLSTGDFVNNYFDPIECIPLKCFYFHIPCNGCAPF